MIAYATLVGSTNDYIFVDDFTFIGGAVIPEPSTMALLGVAGLMGVLRRRKTAA